MQIKITGEMSIKDIRKAIFEKLHEVENEFRVGHSRGATLYINPTDGRGDEIVPRNELGRQVDKILCDGPYRSAADEMKI
ncbi:MAG: hypothetical protein M0P11_09195 [Anaerolineaceae bacterium]|nr:hypothetical protein [Anaerolineaceae bacterium]